MGSLLRRVLSACGFGRHFCGNFCNNCCRGFLPTITIILRRSVRYGFIDKFNNFLHSKRDYTSCQSCQYIEILLLLRGGIVAVLGGDADVGRESELARHLLSRMMQRPPKQEAKLS